MNKNFIMEQLNLINGYVNAIANELNRQETHDYYIHHLAFCCENRIKAILNESKSKERNENVKNENQGNVTSNDDKQKKTTYDDREAGSTASSATENNQSTNEVQSNVGEPTGNSGECNTNEG